MTTDFEQAVIDVLADNLTIESEWTGWDYNDPANELEIKIKLGDRVIATSSVRIHIAERSGSDW